MTEEDQQETCYALCIGIDEYSNTSGLSTLGCAENDAKAMDAVLKARGVPDENRCLLLGADATLDAINEAFADFILDRPQENDLVFFYFAGHGVPLTYEGPNKASETDEQGDIFLATYDFDRLKIKHSSSFRKLKALGMQRLRKDYFEGEEGSRKRFFIFDSCHSGFFFGPRYRDETNPVQKYVEQVFTTKSFGRCALSSCLPEQFAAEIADAGHGRFTLYLLQALQGKAPNAVGRDGWLTVNSLFDYLADQLPPQQRPVLSGVQQDKFKLLYFSDLAELAPGGVPSSPSKDENTKRETYLRALFSDHSNFMQSRLQSFVGRETELTAIQQRIQEKLPTGGYVTITGQAGQGKSSIIAKLVELADPEKVAHHFIPFNPGPDHQVGLMRNIMARLILKYYLSEIYVASESRAALREFFPKVLAEVAEKNAQEVIFIDGLDQLEEELTGIRDLSFLPNNPPPGIVFVLGTRPNDTLKPLTLLKPYNEYQLPNLSRADFDRILKHRNVSIASSLADQFYQRMQENALYLDLVARELSEQGAMSPQDIIARIADNPENLFSLSLERLRRPPQEWREVIKPILGVLLATREPLSLAHLRQILQVDAERLRAGLQRLGGLLSVTGDGCYALFHLKLQDYLRQDENQPGKDYIFATDEEEGWHTRLARWCEGEALITIWQETNDRIEQGRRKYAQQYYVTHLYLAKKWLTLFAVLDEGSYGRAKERYDVGARSYIQDLDLGRRAACRKEWLLEEGIAHLPSLWRYTLLRCTLRSRVDNYPVALFETLLLLGREAEVLGFVELLTLPQKQATVLLLLAEHFLQLNGRRGEGMQFLLRAQRKALLLKEWRENSALVEAIMVTLVREGQWERAEEVAQRIESSYSRAGALRELAKGLSQAGHWERAEEVALSIVSSSDRAGALRELAKMLSQAGHWERVEEVAQRIEPSLDRARALRELAKALSQAGQQKRAEGVWSVAQEVALSIVSSSGRAGALRELAEALSQAGHWERAEEVALSIASSSDRARALRELAEALSQAGQQERAEGVWNQAQEVAQEVAQEIGASYFGAEALRELAKALSQAGQQRRAEEVWNQAQEVAQGIESGADRAEALSELAEVLNQTGQQERAEGVWSVAQQAAQKIESSYSRARALRELAEALSQVRNWERAEEIAQKIALSYPRAEALRELAEALSQAGQQKRAERVWSVAQEAAQRIESSYSRARALRELAEALSQVGNWERAEEVAQKIEESYSRVWALSELAKGLSQAGQQERAERVWSVAQEVAQGIEESLDRAEALSELAKGLSQAGQQERAEEVWIIAQEIAQEIEENSDRARALRELAEALSQAGHWERAEEVAQKIEESADRAKALSELAKGLSQAERWEKAEEAVHCIKLLQLIQRSWSLAETRDYALQILLMAAGMIRLQPDIGIEFHKAFKWVDDFLKG